LGARIPDILGQRDILAARATVRMSAMRTAVTVTAAPDVQGHGVPHGGRAKAGRGSFILTLLSPVVFFSLCIGMGGTGLLIKHFHLPTVIVVFVALAGRRVVALTYGFVN